MPGAKAGASTILGALEEAQVELLDKAVVLTDGKAGTVDGVCLDELHGLRICIKGHDGKWGAAHGRGHDGGRGVRVPAGGGVPATIRLRKETRR